MLKFATYDHTALMGKKYVKKPIPIHAIQIFEEFEVESLEGNYAKGKSGDYLIKGVVGENYICDKTVFELTYEVAND